MRKVKPMAGAPGNPALEMAREVFSHGLNLLRMNRIASASFHFRKALAFDPASVDAALHLAHCLYLDKKHNEALELYDRLLAHSCKNALILNNRGNTLLELRRYQDAANSYEQALGLEPALHDARVALATCYQALGRSDEALAACNAVLAAAPDNAEAHWNRALLLLLQGDYRPGWKEYEWRWQKRNFTSPRRDFTQPRWHGEPVDGKTILIHAEQGFGDTLQFCRYLPLVAACGLRLIFECHPPLAPLMQSLPGVVQVVPMRQPLPPFDFHLPLLSLPLVFDTTVGTIPVNAPYLKPPAERLPFWRSQIIDSSKLKIGICWAGKSYPDPSRSCPVEALGPLADLKDIAWHSLQVGWEAPLPFPMTDLTGHIRDFSDTAALMAQLDLVITIDTAVAHLAGALGVKTWVMLPFAPDWRWMMEREDSPWYPTARLFRQVRPDAWQDVIQKAACSLRTICLR